jgi:hypothetical protein
MKDLLKLWLITKVTGDLLSLVGISLSVGFVAYATFYLLPKLIAEVFQF